MKRYNDSGELDVNGDFYLARDVDQVEDELAQAVKLVAKLKLDLAEALENVDKAVARKTHHTSRHFGFVDPDEAAAFIGAKTHSITVIRSRRGSHIMPVHFLKGPRAYKLGPGKLPQIKARVFVEGVKGRVMAYSKAMDGALIVKLDTGLRVETINWSLVHDTQTTARPGNDRDGSLSGSPNQEA